MFVHCGFLSAERVASGRSPVTVGGSIRTRDHDRVTVRIAHPAFPMIGTTIRFGRIAMSGQHDLGAEFLGALQNAIEVVHFEPEQYPIAVRPVVGVRDGAMVVFRSEAM